MAVPISRRSSSRHAPKGVPILHEDDNILVVDKPPGLLTVGTDTEKTRTLYHRLTDYVRKGNSKSRARIFVVHRLDREASGVLIFAKTPHVKEALQDQWASAEKKYFAVVHGRVTPESETISSYLMETKAHFVRSTRNRTEGKLAHTAYVVLKATREFSLLDIDLLTGRKHQIRVHLAERGHPIVGDKKYGTPNRAHRRLVLHSYRLTVKPVAPGTPTTFETEMPDYFNQFFP